MPVTCSLLSFILHYQNIIVAVQRYLTAIPSAFFVVVLTG